MKRSMLSKVAVVAVAAIGVVTTLSFADAPGATRDNANDISQPVGFEVGGSDLGEQDQIIITQLRGTSDTMRAGNLYEIKGAYQLGSYKHAKLSTFVTTNGPSAPTPIQKTQEMLVDRGSGSFTLYLYMWQDGNPHVSFYSTETGKSLGGIYFGTGKSVLKKVAWRRAKEDAK